ncbi:hypothetical protein D9758_002692 [Tetrapyrgos nigripes]|uniref:Uncharacterized protein n=1 Tax=Tetrapyrgos nigripes TaxID=182062 RepID=A0A8H5GQH7_9AGAR|nr:hypothetical protein D9758_002692 [Tetrapyrgos nigripes]
MGLSFFKRSSDSSNNNVTVNYIIDDQDAEVTYLCDVQKFPQNSTNESESQALTFGVAGGYYQNTWATINSTDCGNAWFKLQFNGTRVFISSRFSLPSSSSGDSSDSSDTGSAYAIELDSDPLTPQPLPPSGLATYLSPLLPADSVDHNLIYVSGNTSLAPTFDYAVITAGNQTTLRGRNIVVDDMDVYSEDPSGTRNGGTGGLGHVLQYKGNWGVLSPETFVLDNQTPVQSYMNTTHWAWGVGDSVKISFAGTSISLYRTIPRSSSTASSTSSINDGNITLSYTLDSNSPINLTLPLTSNSDTPIPLSKFLEEINGEIHTLEVMITEIRYTVDDASEGASGSGSGLDSASGSSSTLSASSSSLAASPTPTADSGSSPTDVTTHTADASSPSSSSSDYFVGTQVEGQSSDPNTDPNTNTNTNTNTKRSTDPKQLGGTQPHTPGFGLDFITYQAAYDDIASMPLLNANGTKFEGPGSGLTSGSLGATNPAVVGWVLGSVGLLLLALGTVVYGCKKRTMRKRKVPSFAQAQTHEKPGSLEKDKEYGTLRTLAGRSRTDKANLSLYCKGQGSASGKVLVVEPSLPLVLGSGGVAEESEKDQPLVQAPALPSPILDPTAYGAITSSIGTGTGIGHGQGQGRVRGLSLINAHAPRAVHRVTFGEENARAISLPTITVTRTPSDVRRNGLQNGNGNDNDHDSVDASSISDDDEDLDSDIDSFTIVWDGALHATVR